MGVLFLLFQKPNMVLAMKKKKIKPQKTLKTLTLACH